MCRFRRSTSPILLLHDNARTHTARATIDALETLKFEFLSHSPYSPDLAPSDFHFFPHLKRDVKGTHSPQMMKWSKLWHRASNKELLNSSLTACINLFYVGKNVLNDKATMLKNKYVNLYLKSCTLLPTFVCLNTWSLFLDISPCALLISRPSYLCLVCILILYVARCVIVSIEGCGRKCPWPNLKYWPSLYHKGLGKTTENLGQYDLSVGQELSPPK